MIVFACVLLIGGGLALLIFPTLSLAALTASWQRNHRRAPVAHPASTQPVSDPNPGQGWTALDDLQLTRLLRDSTS